MNIRIEFRFFLQGSRPDNHNYRRMLYEHIQFFNYLSQILKQVCTELFVSELLHCRNCCRHWLYCYLLLAYHVAKHRMHIQSRALCAT